ncbi:MAG: hypothetical protein JO107_02230 [Hyphomicrobiales bacterium]|nr:hypothetical protein [Hyphomicrobiales bacterium]
MDPLKSDPRPNPTASEASLYPAAELFVTRAFERTGYEMCDSDAPSVAEICRRLDGIPLAVELAATRIGALTPMRLVEMLDDSFEILAYGSRNAPLRQQTLLATLDWSYNLLSDGEAAFARALSVFAGAFDVEGAMALTPDDTPPGAAIEILSSLAAKSFLVVDWQESAVSYRLLETMRTYLSERLHFNGEEDEARRRHATFICALLERAGGASSTGATRDRCGRFERRLDDVRSALAWALRSDKDVMLGIRLAVAALPLWNELSLLCECRETSELALARLDALPIPDQRMRAHLLLGVAIASGHMPENTEAHRRNWESALQAARATDDADLLAQTLSGLAHCEMLAGKHLDALGHIEELRSVVRRLEPGWAKDEGDLLLAMGEFYMGRLPKALVRLQRLVERGARHGLSFRQGLQQVGSRLQLTVSFATVHWLTGSPARAALVADAAVRDALETGHQLSQCQVLAKGTTVVALWNGHVDRASRYAAEFARLATLHQLAFWRPISECIDVLVACAAGEHVRAEELMAPCDAMLALPPPQIRPIFLVMIADALVTRGHLVEASLPINAARAKLQASQGERWAVPELLRVEATLAHRSGNERTAEKLLLRSLALADEASATGWSLRSALSLAQLRRATGREREAAAVLAPVIARVVDGAGTKDFDSAAALLHQLSGARMTDLCVA